MKVGKSPEQLAKKPEYMTRRSNSDPEAEYSEYQFGYFDSWCNQISEGILVLDALRVQYSPTPHSVHTAQGKVGTLQVAHTDEENTLKVKERERERETNN